MTSPDAGAPATAGAPELLDPWTVSRLKPIGVIRSLLGISTAVIAIGVITSILAVVVAIVVSRVPSEFSYRQEFHFTAATAAYLDSAIITLVGALWLGFMSRGLAALLRLAAGPANTDASYWKKNTPSAGS